MEEFEYRNCTITNNPDKNLYITDQLDELGKKGWQLVHIEFTSQSSIELGSGFHIQYYWAVMMRKTTQ